MSEEKQRPIMSREVVNSGKSLRGFLSEEEFMAAVAKNYRKWAGLGFGVGVIVAIAESFTTSYNGPYAPLLAALFGVVMAYVKTVNTGKRFIDEGDDLNDTR